MNQKDLIHKSDWDVLVILDACRYDIFKKVYREFFKKGKLLKAISSATWTFEWVIKTFDGKYDDIVYVSATPFIRSGGTATWRRLFYPGIFRYRALDHFKRVIDVWKFEFTDECEYDTIPPDEMNKRAEVAFLLYPKDRVILHYVQPHGPYILLPLREKKGPQNIKQVTDTLGKEGIKNKLISLFSGSIPYFPVIHQEHIWRFADKLGKLPKDGWGAFWLKYGRERVRQAYIDDLRLVLGYVKQLVERYPEKKFVITADHGEYLGEKGRVGHAGPRSKILVEVPWFIIGGGDEPV